MAQLVTPTVLQHSCQALVHRLTQRTLLCSRSSCSNCTHGKPGNCSRSSSHNSSSSHSNSRSSHSSYSISHNSSSSNCQQMLQILIEVLRHQAVLWLARISQTLCKGASKGSWILVLLPIALVGKVAKGLIWLVPSSNSSSRRLT